MVIDYESNVLSRHIYTLYFIRSAICYSVTIELKDIFYHASVMSLLEEAFACLQGSLPLGFTLQVREYLAT